MRRHSRKPPTSKIGESKGKPLLHFSFERNFPMDHTMLHAPRAEWVISKPGSKTSSPRLRLTFGLNNWLLSWSGATEEAHG